MKLSRRTALIAAGVHGLLATMGSKLAFANSNVGLLQESKNEVWGTMQGASRLALSQAAPIFKNQRVETGDESAAKVKFIDDSQLALGANSNAVIDEYVFAGAQSRSSMKLARGAFRFLSGTMPEKNMKISTPTIGIGIRGTELMIDVYEDGSTELSTIEGAARVASIVTNEVLDVLAGQSILTDAEGLFIGGVRDFIHRSTDELINRGMNEIRSKIPVPIPDFIPNPFR